MSNTQPPPNPALQVDPAPRRRFLSKLRADRSPVSVVEQPTDRAARRRAHRGAARVLSPSPVNFSGENRADRRARRLTPNQALRRRWTMASAAQKSDPAEIRRRAYKAGCHGKSVAPLEAADLEARYGTRPTPAQARRIRKAVNAERGAA